MAQSSPTGGIRCEMCGARMEVSKTLNPCRGVVIRYRECPKCKHSTKTKETIAKQLPRK